MTTALPELWTDWCSVIGVSERQVDESTLAVFRRQARPSRAVLMKLRRMLAPAEDAAPAWPREHRGDRQAPRRGR